MKKFTFNILLLCINSIVFSQSGFDTTKYFNFLNSNVDLEYDEISEMHPLKNQYYKGINTSLELNDYQYFDSICEKFNLTIDEKKLIEQNNFMVSERLSFNDFGNALHSIYSNDMPVFISTDAILHALHMSYDAILKNMERCQLKPNVDSMLHDMYYGFDNLYQKYATNNSLYTNLQDVDIYITIAYSLISDTLLAPHIADSSKLNRVWEMINSENMVKLSLFTEVQRDFDFSQFKVRGHYVDDEEAQFQPELSLEAYFKTMMWLGRIDFWLTTTSFPPIPENDIKRMTLDAFLLNECVELTEAQRYICLNDKIINYFVGESDNLTPLEFSKALTDLNINSASQLLDHDTMSGLITKLKSNDEYQQKILSSLICSNPFSQEPIKLPISYKIAGQRFIIDSYIFTNVVFDNIVYEGEKIFRPMPDPLDALFVLGNENTIPLLQDELETYKYSLQLASMRYLVDSYDADYWESSFYNAWLNALRNLNAPENHDKMPIFAQTAAWQQQKMNTQLASWSQLRHDNLLYAKPSYTGMAGCDYPHSYVEPYPEFFRQLAKTTSDLATFFSTLTNCWEVNEIEHFFSNFSSKMNILQSIAEKELSKTPLSDSEIDFLASMLFPNEECGTIYTGWYPNLFFRPDDIAKQDYIIADIHTQPTDEVGKPVGNVLHAATGKINLGVFLAKSPSNNFHPMAYIGPVCSYYEKTSTDFYRYTDEEWQELVDQNELPDRPDWVNIYMVDNNGNIRNQGREIPAIPYVSIIEQKEKNNAITELNAFPNPVKDNLNIDFNVKDNVNVSYTLYDNYGRVIKSGIKLAKQNKNSIILNSINLEQGIYFFSLTCQNKTTTIKIIK